MIVEILSMLVVLAFVALVVYYKQKGIFDDLKVEKRF